MGKTKQARINGKFVSKEDVKPAVFQSNFPNYTLVMKSYRKTREGLKKGKRLDFSPNGTYETKDADEIEFLERHMKNCGPNTRIRKKRDVELKDEVKDKQE